MTCKRLNYLQNKISKCDNDGYITVESDYFPFYFPNSV